MWTSAPVVGVRIPRTDAVTVFKEHLTKVFDRELGPHLSDVPRDYMLNHMVCDFAETVRWWMHHEQYSAEEISRFFFSATPF